MSDPKLLDVHGALSALLFATQKEMEPYNVEVELRYRSRIYLEVLIDVPNHKVRQIVVDRLNRGVLWGKYDYRFRLVTHSPNAPDGPQTVSATVDLHHDQRKKVAA